MRTPEKNGLEDIARAIEDNSGMPLPQLRESLAEASAGVFSNVHMPGQINLRRRGRPAGSRQATTKQAIKIRLDADIVAALRASGDGWQTRINAALRASLALSGLLAPISTTKTPTRIAAAVQSDPGDAPS